MIEAMKQALDALEEFCAHGVMIKPIERRDALRQAIREHAMYEVQRLGQEIEQEPVAWMKPDVLCDRACMYLCTKGFTQFPECANVPPQRTEQNFCSRCGKRTNDIHTCTPPQDNT